VVITCKDGEIVKADRAILQTDEFFKSMFHFKSQQSSSAEHMTADLSQFSCDVVKALIQFICSLGSAIPSTLESRLELFLLAEYTTNNDLCDIIENEIEKDGVHLRPILGILSGKVLPN
jgi:BTB/POZ domain